MISYIWLSYLSIVKLYVFVLPELQFAAVLAPVIAVAQELPVPVKEVQFIIAHNPVKVLAFLENLIDIFHVFN